MSGPEVNLFDAYGNAASLDHAQSQLLTIWQKRYSRKRLRIDRMGFPVCGFSFVLRVVVGLVLMFSNLDLKLILGNSKHT